MRGGHCILHSFQKLEHAFRFYRYETDRQLLNSGLDAKLIYAAAEEEEEEEEEEMKDHDQAKFDHGLLSVDFFRGCAEHASVLSRTHQEQSTHCYEP